MKSVACSRRRQDRPQLQVKPCQPVSDPSVIGDRGSSDATCSNLPVKMTGMVFPDLIRLKFLVVRVKAILE